MPEGFPKSEDQQSPYRIERRVETGSIKEPRLSEKIQEFAKTVHERSPEELIEYLDTLAREVAGLEDLSSKDDLTLILNRRGFREVWDRTTAFLNREHAKGVSIPSAFLAIDLDNFKSINDTVGHDAGDLFLQFVAERTSALFKEHKEHIFGRVGGR